MNHRLPFGGLQRAALLMLVQLLCLMGLLTGHARAAESFELKASLEYAPITDQYLMVYSSNESTGTKIYSRLLRSDGSPVGPDIRLSTQEGSMIKPVLSYNAKTQRFLVVWGRGSPDTRRLEIVGASVGLDGKAVREEFRISTSNLFDQRPAIAYCPGRNRFLVTWTRGPGYDFEDGVADVYGQFVDGEGAGLVGSNFVISAAENNQFKSDVACDVVNDRFLVVWEDQRERATKDDIHGQLISSDGTMIGGNFLISNSSDLERRPVIAASNRDGSYLVVWESQPESGSTRLVSRKIDANGRLLRESVVVAPEVGGSRGRAAVAYMRSQDVFLVAFDNTAYGEVPDGIHGQFMLSNGLLRQTAFPLTTAKLGQFRPDVAAARNTFLSVWTDYRTTENTSGNRNVYEYFGRVIGNDVALSSRWRSPDSE